MNTLGKTTIKRSTQKAYIAKLKAMKALSVRRYALSVKNCILGVVTGILLYFIIILSKQKNKKN